MRVDELPNIEVKNIACVRMLKEGCDKNSAQ